MKQRILLILLGAIMISLSGCSTSKVEKEPVVIDNSTKNSLDHSLENLTPSVTPESNQSTTDAEASDTDNSGTNAQSEDTTSPFLYTIEIEGMKETINCKTFTSANGYSIFYDYDRFHVTTEEGIDSFTTENPDPEIYPYVYFNIRRFDLPTDDLLLKSSITDWKGILNNDNKYYAYVLRGSGQLVLDMDNAVLGYLDSDETIVTMENVILSEYNSYHYTVTEGNEWNSPVHEFYYLIKDHYVYEIEVQYYVEAAEGYGSRIQALLDTITLE